MNVRVRLFAAARQAAGRDAVEVDLPPGATIADLRGRLAEEFPQLSAILPHVLFAVNTEYAGDSTPIPAGAEIACIPPVSGG
jgi:molybdopterin synthase sulfur carrier subunit